MIVNKIKFLFPDKSNLIKIFRNSSQNIHSSEVINQNQKQITTTKQDVEEEKKSETKLESKNFDVSLIPKSAKDNFLIEFNKKTPTYDQLFEYQIDQKLYNRFKFLNESRFLGTDFKIKMTKKYDLSLSEFKYFLRRKVDENETKFQRYVARRHGILGPDLAAANFILSRGGRVRFKHQPDIWTIDLESIPKTFDKKYRLLSIDASELNLIYDGLDNIILLHELEELNLSGNPKLDDWACDKIARLFRNSKKLHYLNLSDLPHLTHRGVECLYKINSLKTLVIRRTKAAQFQFIDLLILMFNDVNPNCKIIYQ